MCSNIVINKITNLELLFSLLIGSLQVFRGLQDKLLKVFNLECVRVGMVKMFICRNFAMHVQVVVNLVLL